ncbi:Sensor histidine kinase YpdA [compost metagenome]
MPKTGKGTIRITVEREEDRLVITVDDDGIGMPGERLERLREKLKGQGPAEQGGGGIGVKNVHDRITALYGPEFGIRINSTPNIGTSVRMILPYQKEAADSDNGTAGG